MSKYEKQLRGAELELRETLGKAQAITQSAANEGRGLTEDEKSEVNAHLKAVEVITGRVNEIKADIETYERVKAVGTGVAVVEDSEPKTKADATPRARSIGEAFVKSAEYRALKERGLRGQWSTGVVEMEGKTLLDSSGVGSDATGLIQPDVQPGILPKLFQPLTVASLIAQGSTNSSIVRYLVEITATNGATGVAEGAAKPESALAFDAVDVTVKKIATLLPVTDEMLEDVAALQSYINSRLSLFVRQEEERQLLDGAGGNEVDGLLGQIPGGNLAVVATVPHAQVADHVYAAITKVRLAFLEPTGVVMHPSDWEKIQLLKNTQGSYLFAGSPGSETGPRLWGLPVVVTQAIAEGTALVGAFATGAQMFRRGGLSVEASNSHSDFFAKNKTAIRAEERFALAVYRPAAFATANVSGS